MKLYTKINTPKDLSQITTIDKNAELNPSDTDIKAKDKEKIWKAVETLYKTGIHPALSFVLRHKGKVILKRGIGTLYNKNLENGNFSETENKNVSADTPFCMFSTSKAVTAMLVHKLAEEGLLNLEDRVSKFVPAFAVAGKENITIAQVLAHRSGLALMPKDYKAEYMFDYYKTVKMICDSKPAFRINRSVAYHAISYGYILGAVIESAAGKDLRDVIDEKFRIPLGFKYFQYGIVPEEKKNLVKNYYTGITSLPIVDYFTRRGAGVGWKEFAEISNDQRYLDTKVPAANLIATAEEMSVFFQMLLNGGEYKGVQIFKKETIEKAVIPRTKVAIDKTIFLPMRYSQGMMLGIKPFGFYGWNADKAYGHWGFINTFCWADPDRDISVALLTSGKPFLALNLAKHIKLLWTISRTIN